MYLVVQSTTRAIDFPKKGTYGWHFPKGFSVRARPLARDAGLLPALGERPDWRRAGDARSLRGLPASRLLGLRALFSTSPHVVLGFTLASENRSPRHGPYLSYADSSDEGHRHLSVSCGGLVRHSYRGCAG